MHEGEKAFRDLLESWKDDPDFVAEEIAIDLSSAVSSALKSMKMTQKQLADKIKVSAARISQIMSGNLNLTLLTMCKVALGVGLRPMLDFSSSEERARPILAGAAAVSWTTSSIIGQGRPVYSATLPYVAVQPLGVAALADFATTAPESAMSQATGPSPAREKGAAA